MHIPSTHLSETISSIP